MKTLIVYVHLIAACVAVGLMLIQDLALAKTRGQALSKIAVDELQRAAKTISMALIALWISGLLLVAIGYADNPQEYLVNQKLWAKFTVVGILTLNGIALHHFSFPRVVSSSGIFGLGNIEKTLVVLTGVISSVSWLFACYLGIARPWNYTVNYSFVMTVYFSLLVPACLGGCILIHALRFFPQDFFRSPLESFGNNNFNGNAFVNNTFGNNSFPNTVPVASPANSAINAAPDISARATPSQKKSAPSHLARPIERQPLAAQKPTITQPEPPLLTDTIKLPESMRLGSSIPLAKRASKT